MLAPLAGFVLAAGCFEIAPPEVDAGVTGSTLNGRILVVGGTSTAQSTAIDQGMRRTRSALSRLAQGHAVRVGDLGPDATPTFQPEGRRLDGATPRAKEPRPLEWVAGDAIIGFKWRRYTDKAKVRSVLDEVVTRAAAELRGVTVTLDLCSAWMICRLRLTDAEGKALSLEQTARVATALDRHKGDAFLVVARNYIKHAFRVPNDEHYIYQWHYEFAKLPSAWDITTGDPSMVIAVIDTGLKQLHPDMIGRAIEGFDFISDEGIAADGDGRDPDAEDPGDQALGQGQSSWHGTHVAGTLGANTDNGTGVAGVTWGPKIMPLRVLGLNSAGQDFDIISAIAWGAGDPNIEGVPTNPTPAKVLNLSLGGPSTPDQQTNWTNILTTILDTQKEFYGSPIFVTAAGNENAVTDNITPANIAGVITVGAHRFDGRRAEYSNWGSHVDVMGPGGQVNVDQNVDGFPDGVLSTYDTAYNYEQGTSMATPHVAGIAALLASVTPDIDQATALQVLRETANPAGVCNEGCGAGHVDATAALLQSGGTIADTPLLAVDATRLIFQPEVSALAVTVINLGAAPLDYTTDIVGSQEGLFAVSPASGSLLPGGILPGAVTLTRGEFGAGSANLEVIGQGAAAGQVVRVDLFFNDDAVPSQQDLSAVQVIAFRLLEDGQTIEPAADPVFALRNADFEWQIEDLDPGTYYVFAVGDDNNDGTFDPDRESFGAWPVANKPTPIEVGEAQNITGVEFGLSGGFRVDGTGGVGATCGNNLDCAFAADAECLPWEGGYCTRECNDGFCGAGASCEILECSDEGGNPISCNVCLSTCASETNCRGGEGYICDPYGTCTPSGF
jgi:serine protease